MSSWCSDQALILWWGRSRRFLGPIKWCTDRKPASAIRIGCRLVHCQNAGPINKTAWRCQVGLFSYWYRYDLPHLIPSNVPEVFVFFLNDIQSRYIDKNDKSSYVSEFLRESISPTYLVLTFIWKTLTNAFESGQDLRLYQCPRLCPERDYSLLLAHSIITISMHELASV